MAQDISALRVDPNSAAYLAHMNAGSTNLHPDFGSDPLDGIPYAVVPGAQPRVAETFDYATESDPGPYPIPSNVPVEQGGDAHIIVIDKDSCILYETWDSRRAGDGWHCGSGAIFNLASNALRPDNWTSADAAGLPVFAGLARVDETNAGTIDHALRFTVQSTQNSYVHPATHGAGNDNSADAPPMGLRVRLNAAYDLSAITGQSKAILIALKKYGLILADNGSDWYISGASDPRWNDDDLNQLKNIPASAFEVVQLGPILPQQ